MKKCLLIILCLTLVLLTACSDNSNSKTDKGKLNTPAENKGVLSSFKASELYGKEIDQTVLADHKLTMVNVWATFCGPCINEMPDLGALAAEYESKGVQIVGLISDVLDSNGAVDEGQVITAKAIVTQTNANYLHIIPSNDLLGLLYEITSVPTTFFVDENGNQVGEVYVGARSKSDWKAIIDSLILEVS